MADRGTQGRQHGDRIHQRQGRFGQSRPVVQAVIIPVTFMLVTTKIDADLTQAGAEARRFACDGRRRIGLPADGGFTFAIDADFLHRHRLPGIPLSQSQ